MIKVSDYIFDYLKSKGIDTIFSISGGMSAHLLNSIKEKGLNYVCNYNEQACAMAAEGYARITNKPACVLVTNGPGSTNTITGVLGAYQDSIPMVVISGQVPTDSNIYIQAAEISKYLTKNIHLSDKLTREGNFKKKSSLPNFFELYQKNVLILGFGRIGRIVFKFLIFQPKLLETYSLKLKISLAPNLFRG